MFLPGQREKYFEPPQNYNSSADDNENDDDDDDDDDDDFDDELEDNDPPQNKQLHRSKKDAKNDEELEGDIDEELDDGKRLQEEEDVPNIRDMNQREKLRLLEELEKEIHSEREGLEQENEVLKSSGSRWPVPIPYFLESSLSSSKYE